MSITFQDWHNWTNDEGIPTYTLDWSSPEAMKHYPPRVIVEALRQALLERYEIVGWYTTIFGYSMWGYDIPDSPLIKPIEQNAYANGPVSGDRWLYEADASPHNVVDYLIALQKYTKNLIDHPHFVNHNKTPWEGKKSTGEKWTHDEILADAGYETWINPSETRPCFAEFAYQLKQVLNRLRWVKDDEVEYTGSSYNPMPATKYMQEYREYTGRAKNNGSEKPWVDYYSSWDELKTYQQDNVDEFTPFDRAKGVFEYTHPPTSPQDMLHVVMSYGMSQNSDGDMVYDPYAHETIIGAYEGLHHIPLEGRYGVKGPFNYHWDLYGKDRRDFQVAGYWNSIFGYGGFVSKSEHDVWRGIYNDERIQESPYSWFHYQRAVTSVNLYISSVTGPAYLVWPEKSYQQLGGYEERSGRYRLIRAGDQNTGPYDLAYKTLYEPDNPPPPPPDSAVGYQVSAKGARTNDLTYILKFDVPGGFTFVED